MGKIVPLLIADPIADEDLSMALPFQKWTRTITDQAFITGIGTPEGVVKAPQFSLYIDETGITGTIEYRKMLTDIAGDTSKGWILA